MIEHYIDFIKNEKEELAEKIKSNIFINDILKQYKNITLNKNEVKEIKIKKIQITRALQNVIENSEKFAKNTFVSSYFSDSKWIITIEDDGPGIDLSPFIGLHAPLWWQSKGSCLRSCQLQGQATSIPCRHRAPPGWFPQPPRRI